MAQRIEAFGQILEFPDGMSDADMAQHILANEADLNPNYSPPISSRIKSFAEKSLGINTEPKLSIADQAEASALKGENAAALQVPGAPVRQSAYNQALLNPGDTGHQGITSRIAKAADEDIKGQANQQELELLRTEAMKPSESGFGSSAMQTVGRTIKGAGQVASDFFDADKDNAVTNYGQKLLDENPTWVKSLGDIKDEPLLAVKEATGNSLGSMGGMVGVAAVGAGITSIAPLTGPIAPIVAAVGQAVQWLGPAAVAALPSYSGIRDAQILKDPKNEADAKSKAIAGIGAAAVGAIEVAFGPQQWAIAMLTKEGRAAMARKFAATSIGHAAVKGAAVGAVVEGAEEIVQSPIEQLASYEDPTTRKSLEDTAFSGAMGALGGSTAGAATSPIAYANAQRTQRQINKVAEAPTVDDAIKAATSPEPTLDDIIKTQQPATTDAPVAPVQETEIVMPDNTSVKAQWQVVDADNVKASMKEGIAQPRDRTRAASDIQVKSIANAPDYRRLSDSPVMDVGAPVIDMDGNIVAGNGRFEGISQAHEQGTGKEYLVALKADAVRKGIDPSVIEGMKKPVLVRAITQPIDTRKMAIASNAGGSLQYSALELAKIDSERMKGIENLEVNDIGDIALTPKNITQLKDSLGQYTAAELGSLVGKGGELSQEGVKRVRNAMLARAYGASPVLERLVESTDSDMRNVLGALTKSAGHIIKTKGNTTALLEAVDTYAQLKATGQPVDNFLAQQDAFSEGLSKEAEDILRFVDGNARSQKKLTDFIKDGFVEVDTTSDDMFATPQKPLQSAKVESDSTTTIKAGKVDALNTDKYEAIPIYEHLTGLNKDERITKLETYLKDSGYDFTVEPASVRDVDALDSAAKAAEKIAKFFKKKVVFVKADGPFSINGVMVPSIADTVFIDIRTKKSLVAVMGHELSHWLEQDKPALYKQLIKSLKKVIKEDATKGYAKKYGIQGATEVELTKEIVGDIMGDNFTEQSFWDKVAKANPTSFKDVAAAIIKWLKGVILKAKSQGMGSEEWVKDATKAQDILAKAVAQYTGESNAAGTEGGVKFNVTGDNEAAISKAKKLLRGLRSLYIKARIDTQEPDFDLFTEFVDRRTEANDILASMLEAGELHGMGVEDKWFLSRNTTSKNPWRISYFGATDKQPNGHSEYTSAKQALSDANLAVSKDKLALFSRAYHGSPHDHNKFDTSKIGTGEGAQAYGYGHYFAESKDVAEWYRESTTATNSAIPKYITSFKVDGKDILNTSPDYQAADIAQMMQEYNVDPKTKEGKDWLNSEISARSMARDIGSPSKLKVQVLRYLTKDIEKNRTRGKLYEVELAPEQDEYLLWDRPLSEQSDKVKSALGEIDFPITFKDSYKAIKDVGSDPFNPKTINIGSGNQFYSDLAKKIGGSKAASEYLHSLGIRGIKYLDGSSRHKSYVVVLSNKQGEYARSEFDNKSQAEEYAKDKRTEGFITSVKFNDDVNFNYVIFDDKDVSITAKFSRNPLRLWMPTPRSPGWTEEKIIRALKSRAWSRAFGKSTVLKEIAKFDSAEEFADHIYYHGTGSYVSNSLVPSITMSEAEAERSGGGGYGERYWAVSLSKSKELASNFTAQSDYGTVYGVILRKGANVRTIPGIEDAAEIEDHVVQLWNDGIDAVDIGGGEQELAVLNPAAIVRYENGESFGVFKKKKFEPLTTEQIEDIYAKSKEFAAKLSETELEERKNLEVPKVKFSKSEVERTLIAQHNLSVSNLIHADRMGALAVPSIAITDKAHPLTGFGEITLLADEDFVNGARTFGADIYSTRYPTIRYKFTVKDADKLNEMFKGEMDRIGDTSQFYPDSFGYDPHQTLKEIPAVAMKFLEAEGIKPKIKYVKARTKPDAIFNKWVKSSLDKYGLSNDDAFIADVKVQYKEQFKDVDKLMPSTDEAWRNVARNRADDIVRYRESVRDKGKLDLDATRNSMVEQIRLHKKMYKFEGYINSVINEINPKQRISDKNGNKQIEHTLDNVIRNMRSSFVGGENFGLGLGKIRSPHAPEFKSIAQIRKNKQRLMTSEDFGAVVKEVDKELHELSSRVNEYGTYTGYDNVEQAIFDSAKMGISRALTYNGFKNVPDDVKLEIEQFISKLRNMPTEYFEAKVLRGVGIGEFKAAVVPKDIAPEALAILKKNGITDIRMYKPGSSEDRFKQINSVKHVMFSRAPKLYSKLEQALEAAADKVFSTGPQVKMWLQSNAGKLGIKKDEIYWSGIDNWLDAQGKVNKQQVVEFVRDNGVTVEDVTLGADNEFNTIRDKLDRMLLDELEDRPVDKDEQATLEKRLREIKNTEPKHNSDKLTLPGGTDYKELVVTVPTIEPHNANDSTHFGDTGGGRQIGWIRMDTRDGGLFIEELQSQRAQQGRSRGFLNNDNTSVNAELGELYNKVHDVDGYKVVFYNDVGIPRKQVKEVIGFKKYADKFWTDEQYDSRLDGAMPSGKPAQFDGVPLAEHLTSTPVWQTWHDEVIKLRELSAKLRLSVPPAPFVSDANNKATNAYVALLMKKALIEAVSNDHASVSWTTGEQQADRYDLSKQIGRVTYTDDKTLRAYDVNDDRIQVINQQLNDDKELVDYIGKDAAEKLLTQPARKNGKRELSGLALKTGGEWAQSMYGNEQGLNARGKPSLISQAANDIFKHVGSGKVEIINGQPGFYVTPEMKSKDLPLFSRVTVDGVERPTTNSEGKQINNPVNFWKWFGDSKVVDKQGRPLVVYHGTKKNFDTFEIGAEGKNSGTFGTWVSKRAGLFFAEDASEASEFAMQGENREGSNVIPAYLSIQNPADLRNGFEYDPELYDALVKEGISERVMVDTYPSDVWELFDEEQGGFELVKALKAAGYDGARIAENNPDTGEQLEVWVAFDPNQIKSATGNNGDYSSTNNDIRFSFAGPKAETADKYALDTAQQRLAAGEDADKVRQATGWFKGVDDKWRFEINDSDAQLTTLVDAMKGETFGDITSNIVPKWRGSLRVKDVLDHPKLFNAYPEIAERQIRSINGTGGSFNVITKSIGIGNDVSRYGIKAILLHEIQHGIQRTEGFATGGSESSAATLIRDNERKRDAYVNSDAYKEWSKEQQELIENTDDESTLQVALEKHAKKRPPSDYVYIDALDTPRSIYAKLAGEVEARNTQKRIGMTDDDRREVSPRITQDTYDKDQIIVYNGVEMRSEPDTVTVDGVERPTTNSEGKSINNPVNFWKWFGDSTAVDDQGRPLVVYHGTTADFTEFDTSKLGSNYKDEASSKNFFFTTNKDDALSFGDKVKEFYLKLGRLKTITDDIISEKTTEWLNTLRDSDPDEYDFQINTKQYQNSDDINKGYELAIVDANNSGYISTVYQNEFGDKWFTVRDHNQIKSAVGNNDIRFSKEEKKFDIPETRFRKFQRMNQDSFNRFTVIREWLEKNGQKLSDMADVYGAEERYHSKVANQLEDFREFERNPLIEKIQKAGYTLGDIEVFLKMQHAQEANAQIRKITGNPDAMAAGITDEEAAEYLAEAPKELATLANELRDITEQTKQLRLDAGILNTDITGGWEGAYKYYIPMKGEADAERGTGKGLTVNFKSKRRLGHGLRDEHVIENIFMDHERAIMEVEKNRVGKSLVMMGAEMQRPDIISIAEPEKRKVLKTDTAYVVEANGVTQGVFATQGEAKIFKQLYAASMPNVAPSAIVISQTKDQRVIATASPMLADNEVNVYMNGHAIRVQINDELLARAYTKLGVEQFTGIIAAGRILNGYLSKVYTGYNPEFILTNMVRDFTAGIINLTGEEGFTMATKALVNYPKMFSDLLKYAASNGKSSTKLIDSYRANGGNTGAAYLSDMERLGNEVATEYAAYQGVMANLKQGDTMNAARAAGKKLFKYTLKWIYNLNQAGENAMRLAAYKAMLDSGRTVNEAAKVAKNITVNFNRKGERKWTPALYLFFNATIQGTAAVSHALLKGKHKYQAQALAAGMAAVGYMVGAALGGGDEDDWEKINEYTKERNVLIKSDDGYAKIPLPYGHAFFYNLGRHIAEAQRTGEWGVVPWHLATSAISEFTPLNDAIAGSDTQFESDQVFMGLLPTALKIPAQPIFNKQLFTGAEVMPDSEFDKSQPEREKMWRGTKGTMYDKVAGWLEAAGFDVSPETLKYITRTFTGGAGALVDTAISSAMLKKEGATLDAAEIPFVRKGYMELGVKDARAAFHKAAGEARTAAETFNRIKRKNDLEKLDTFLADGQNLELLALDNYADKLRKWTAAERDIQDALRADESISVKEKRLKLKELEKQETQYYDDYLDLFKASKPRLSSGKP